MRSRLLLLVLLVASDAGLFWISSRLAAERDRLIAAQAAGRTLDEARFAAREHERRVADLEKRLSSLLLPLPLADLDIARLRDLLIGAERGLDLHRLNLDFRPDDDPSAGAGRGKIQASLSGSFAAICEYLRRVEALRLPLRPDDVALRLESSEQIALSVSWTALWGSGGGIGNEISEDDVARLDRWLAREASPPPERNLFSARSAEMPPAPPAVDRARPLDEESKSAVASTGAVEIEAPTPTLAGFVLARPEVEKDLSSRVLAALRFEGEIRLVKIGDVIGGFRVERIDARESVILVDRTTGERRKLLLE
jgi:hypothetical protein